MQSLSEKQIPLFNWSLKKALETQPDNFVRARIRIIYTIALFALFKSAIVLVLGSANGQWLQVIRAVAAFAIYATLLKVLLYRPSRMKVLSHIMIQAGILVIWTNIFVYTHKINLVTVQFVFMIVLSGFYTLGNRPGFIYSALSIFPVVLFLLFKGHMDVYLSSSVQEFPSPGFEIIVVLNFISITIAHYLFYHAYHANMREKERLNQQLQIAIAEANKLAATKTNFLSTMSHELRTPLNSVIGITELLLDDKPEERHKENLKILHFSTLDLLALINNILDFNKIDSDKLTLEAVPFRLMEFMQNICSVLRIKARDKELDFVLDIDERLRNTNVISDPTRLSQLIYNLVSNAIKFTERGGVTVRLEYAGGSEQQTEVMFSVKDTGIGIHRDRHDTIFEMFGQGESHITRRYGGTGLGLAIVKQVLVLFNSSIELESEPGAGARFYFTIKFDTTTTTVQTVQPGSKTDLSHLRILVAEDNDVNRLLIKKQLDKLHLTAIMAENGEQAFEAYENGDYDAIFMDLHMPVADGYVTTQQIRDMKDPVKAGVYIVAFTASVTEQQKITEAGFDDFLYKPVNMHDLRDKLELIAMRKEAEV